MASKATRSKDAKEKRTKSGAAERYQKALEGYDRGIKALHKGDPAKAKEQFDKLLQTYPEEKELMDRVRSFVTVCETRMAPQRRLKDAEEMINAGVVSLNDGDPHQAIKHLTKAAELEPKNSHAQYCLAAAYAVCGDATASARHLKLAISGDPSTQIHAKADEDFASVRSSADVASLLAGA